MHFIERVCVRVGKRLTLSSVFCFADENARSFNECVSIMSCVIAFYLNIRFKCRALS
jgi:hypothetical protein